MESIELTRISNDVNGNPRYVCHFLNFINDNDRITADKNTSDTFGVDTLYKIAVKKANKIGGRKYHTKSYGGGIVFQSYNTDDLKKSIAEIAKTSL